MFDSGKRIVGVLSGGFAGCGTPGTVDDNNEPDWFGRIALGFQNGDYANRTLADWLDPLNTGTDTLGGLSQVDDVDLTPPGPIQDLQIAQVNTSELTVSLEWTATGDDLGSGTADHYDLRFDTSPIETQEDFENAQRVTDVIRPAEAGQREHFDVTDADGLQLDSPYYFALVAVDDAGNRSPRATTDREVVLVKDIEVGPGGTRAGTGSGTTQTEFVVNRTQEVRITLYDLLGRRVKVLYDQRAEEGFRQVVQFETRRLASGPYFLHFMGETFVTSRKIVVVD